MNWFYTYDSNEGLYKVWNGSELVYSTESKADAKSYVRDMKYLNKMIDDFNPSELVFF